MQRIWEPTEIQEQLIKWIVADVTAFSPSYLKTKRIIFIGFSGPESVFEYDGVQMHSCDQSSLKAKRTKARRGGEGFIFIATMEGDSSFRLRFMGMRGSGGNTLYGFKVIDGALVVEVKSQAIMA